MTTHRIRLRHWRTRPDGSYSSIRASAGYDIRARSLDDAIDEAWDKFELEFGVSPNEIVETPEPVRMAA